VTIDGGNSNVQEWVALYVASNPDSSWSIGDNYWKYLNGTQTVPSTAVPYPVTLAFTAPTTLGTYNFRYFAQNGFANRLAISSNITVTSSLSSCDLNQDNSTNILDLQHLANVILGKSICSGLCDINKDGQVNIIDLQYLANVILGKSVCI
ncbi:MAG: dockerin type I domain-containing protein, partial [Patescibacteria group bacterium]